MSKYIFVAKNQEQLKYYARKLKISLFDITWVDELDKIRGYADLPCYFVGQWYDLKDSGDIRAVAQVNNLKIEYIES